ncbi:MAG: hypothetical protein U0746_03095 [Gemmataceae bacterium]
MRLEPAFRFDRSKAALGSFIDDGLLKSVNAFAATEQDQAESD